MHPEIGLRIPGPDIDTCPLLSGHKQPLKLPPLLGVSLSHMDTSRDLWGWGDRLLRPLALSLPRVVTGSRGKAGRKGKGRELPARMLRKRGSIQGGVHLLCG